MSSLQKKAIRIVAKVYTSMYHTEPLFKKFKCLKFIDLVQLQTCITVFKANNSMLSPNLQNLFIKSNNVHSHFTRSSNNFHQKYVKTSLKSFCISVNGIKCWNSLPTKLRCCSRIREFRNVFKSMCFDEYNLS